MLKLESFRARGSRNLILVFIFKRSAVVVLLNSVAIPLPKVG